MYLHKLISHTCKVINFNDRDDNERFLQCLYCTLCLPYMKAPAKVLRSQRPSNGSVDARYKSNPYSRFYCIHLYIIDAPFTPFLPRIIYHVTLILCFAFDNKYFRMQILLFFDLIRKLLQSILVII